MSRPTERSNGPERIHDRAPGPKARHRASGKAGDGKDAFFADVNSELSNKGFFVARGR
jgi:hypothetical protein